MRRFSILASVSRWVGVFGLLMVAMQAQAAEAIKFRPPAAPLVAHDPYWSIWSPADRLTDAGTMHWTGRSQPLRSLVRVDGKAYRVMGVDPADVPALPQVDLSVYPTRTVYEFTDARISLTLTFLTPALPSDLDVLSRPVTYLVWEVRSADGQPHAVQVYFDAGPELAVDRPDQKVVWETPAIEGLDVLKLGTQDQPALVRKGDDLRIDWGYLYVAATSQQGARLAISNGVAARSQFLGTGATPDRSETSTPTAVRDGAPVLAASFDLGQVGQQPVSRHVMLAYDDVEAIKYFGGRLRPYWRRNGVEAADMLQAAARDYETLVPRCRAFDEQLMADLTRVGGRRYALLCALAYRQTLAGNKIAADANGMPLVFPKECFSNGCISTVDVLFPQAPFYLALSPAMTKGMLVPILDYASSPVWPYPYAPHDLGTYPLAIGQYYAMGGGDGDRMPVEESGNMLIMVAAVTRAEDNAEFAEKYWPLLTCWADYLVNNGLDPVNQLCSADMFGPLPHSTNLALKAIIGIGGYAQMCERLGKKEDAARYMETARRYASQWQEKAKDNGRMRLAYDLPGSWSMKHNLVWDRILGTGLFPDAVGDAEAAWYLKIQNRYGLQVDNRTDKCLIDWAFWSIALARDPGDFQALVEPIFHYADETPGRVPLSDYFSTVDAKPEGFQARPVVGGIFVQLLADSPSWKKWAGEASKASGSWAEPPMLARRDVQLVPTAQKSPVLWRYTLEKPADDWYMPEFDDSAWQEGPAGFGSELAPAGVVRTKWTGQEIWLRREFTLDAKPNNPGLSAHCDEDGIIYINGVLAIELPGWTPCYQQFDIRSEAAAVMRPGTNVLAVHCRQAAGEQYVDVGIIDAR